MPWGTGGLFVGRLAVSRAATTPRLMHSRLPLVEILWSYLVRVADRRGQSTRLSGGGFTEKHQALRIAAVDAALGHYPVHGDVPALRLDTVHPGQFVANADHRGSLC